MGIGIFGGGNSKSVATYQTTTETTSTAQEISGVGNTAITYGTGVTVAGLSDENLNRVLDTVDAAVSNVSAGAKRAYDLTSETASALTDNAVEAMKQTAAAWGTAKSETKQVLQDLEPYAVGLFVIALASILVLGIGKRK